MNYYRIALGSILYFILILLNTSETRYFEPTSYSDGISFSVKKSLILGDSLTALSWKLFIPQVNKKAPLWVTRMLKLNQSEITGNCAIEILTIIPKKHKFQFGESNAIIRFDNSKYVSVKCYYVSVAVGWEKKRDSSSPPRPAFYYCPISNKSMTENAILGSNLYNSLEWTCNEISSKSVNISLISSTTDISYKMATWFITNSPRSRELSNLHMKYQIGTCTNAMHRTDSSAALLQTFIRHHNSLDVER